MMKSVVIISLKVVECFVALVIDCVAAVNLLFSYMFTLILCVIKWA